MIDNRVFAVSDPAFADASVWKKHGELFRHQGEPANDSLQNYTSRVEPLEDDR